MSETEDRGPTEDFAFDIEDTIDELEETKEDLEELDEWLDEAPAEWDRMSHENKQAFRRRAGELQTQLRNATTPEELLEHATEIREAFSEPIEQTAVARFHDILDLLEVDLSEQRMGELEDQIRQRPATDLQTDADGYGAVIEILDEEPSFVRTRIARRIENDPATYLIGPTTEFTPLVQSIRQRRESLAELEVAFADAGRWVPSELTALREEERLYESLEQSVDIGAIEDEIVAIDDHVESSQYDITDVVKSEIQRELSDCSPEEFQSTLNDVAAALARFINQYHNLLQEVEGIITDEDTPVQLGDEIIDLESKFRHFENNSPVNIAGLNSEAGGVQSEFEAFLEATGDELQTLDSMCSEIRMSFGVSEVRETPTPTDLGTLSPSDIRNDLDAAFDAIEAYRAWVDDVFEAIGPQFEADDVRDLFERLYTEEEVALSEIDIEVLEELQEDLPIVVSLQR